MAKRAPGQKSVSVSGNKGEAGFSLSYPQLYPLIVFAFSFAIYFNTIFNDYNLDDELVTQNHRLTSKGFEAIPEIFTSPYYSDNSGYKYEYRPMVLVSFAIEHSIFGDNPHISHFINVLLYSLMCLLLFMVLRKMLRKYNILFPFITTLIFAAHPIHTEVVASIKNRDEILALLFALLSLDFALRFVEQKKLYQFPLILLFFLAGILSKLTTITFALLIPLTLIMFTEAGLGAILLITLMLAIPSSIYSRLNMAQQQVGLVLVFILVTTGFYCFKYFRDFSYLTEKLKTFYSEWKTAAKEENVTDNGSSFNFTFLKKPMGIFVLVFLIVIPCSLSLVGIYYVNVWLSCIPLLIPVVLFLVSRPELQLILITPISLLALALIARLQADSTLIDAGLVAFLATQTFGVNNKTRIVAVVNAVIYAAVTILLFQSLFFASLLFFLLFINRKLWPVSALAIAATGIAFIMLIASQLGNLSLFGIHQAAFPLLYLSVWLVWKNKKVLVTKAAVVLIPASAILFFLFEPHIPVKNIYNDIETVAYHVNTTHAVDPTPVQAYRPLKFMEYPITPDTPLKVKLGTALIVLGKYLKLVFLPYNMSYYYGYAHIVPTDIMNGWSLFALALYSLLAITALVLYRRMPLFSYGILFYLISISVFTNLAVPVAGLMGDRFLLVPSIGFCLCVAGTAAFIFKQNFLEAATHFKWIKQPLKISLFVLLSIYSVATIARNTKWKDRVTLFRNDIKVVEKSAPAQNLLALHLFLASNTERDPGKQQEMRREAVGHFKRALEIYPGFLNAAYDLGRTYEAMGEWQGAYNAYEATYKIDTTFNNALFGMALIEGTRGNVEKAIPLYEKYLSRNTTRKEAYANLSYAYFQLKNYDKAIEVNKRLMVMYPSSYEPYENIGKTFLSAGKRDSALYYFEKEYPLNPNDPNLVNMLYHLSGEMGDKQKAEFYRQKGGQ